MNNNNTDNKTKYQRHSFNGHFSGQPG